MKNAECDIVRTGLEASFRIDFGGAAADEPLFEAGPLRLAIRMAGKDPDLAKYDRDGGNYLTFPMPDSSCPVVEATAAGLRVGIPLGLLPPRADGVRDVVVRAADSHFSISIDGCADDDMFAVPSVVCDLTGQRTLSSRVASVRISVPAGPVAPVPDSRPIRRSIQYWTPDGHDAWVGDVAPCAFGGRLHVFYLFDRRHHGSKRGAGGHWFAHLSSADLVQWDEHPPAVPIKEWWETLGTGTPFEKDGRLCLAYGLHTDRIVKDGGFPMGGTCAVSDDGVHFAPTGRIFTEAQNPSVYARPGGGFELVTSYGGTKGLFRSPDLEHWMLFDGDLPFRGDCPSLFDWHGRRYLIQGFVNAACSSDGAPGSFVDWSREPDAPYDGLSVPMVVPWKDDRRLYVGWLRHPAGWGGWLVFRELVAHPDGRLGMKWVPEIEPPVPPLSFRAGAGESFVRKFLREDGGPALVLRVDPAKREAAFFDDADEPVFEDRWKADNVRIGALRCVDGAYGVRLVVWYDRKADATVFDAEIGGGRTLICRRRGRFHPEGLASASREGGD